MINYSRKFVAKSGLLLIDFFGARPSRSPPLYCIAWTDAQMYSVCLNNGGHRGAMPWAIQALKLTKKMPDASRARHPDVTKNVLKKKCFTQLHVGYMLVTYIINQQAKLRLLLAIWSDTAPIQACIQAGLSLGR